MGRKVRRPSYRPYNVGEYRLGWFRGQFAVAWQEGGKRRRFTLHVSTEQEARTAIHAFVGARAETKIDKDPTIEQLFQLYVADREIDGVQVHKLHWKWKVLAPQFGYLRPRDLTKQACKDFEAMRKAQGKMLNTIESELRQLRTILNWAVKSKIIDVQPTTWVPKADEPRTRHLTWAEINRLLDSTELAHARLFIVLALATAARMSAILDLTWDRVDFTRGLIHLHDPSRARTNKGRAIVPMNDSARAALSEAKLASASDYVIEWNGRRIADISRAIDTALIKAGLKQGQDGAHLLRHTAAVFMAEAGVPMTEISQYLGHRSTETTERVYARYSPDYLRKAASVLNLPPARLRA